MTPDQVLALGLDHPPLALLVDRDADTRRMYAEFLHLAGGCNVDEAEDGREALAKALTRSPDVVVTETQLPGLSGYDLCMLLRRDSTTSTIPIIFVTGDAFDADIRRAQRAGADVVLTKPCLPDQLLVEIKKVLVHSADLRGRSRVAREKVARQIGRSQELMGQWQDSVAKRRIMLSRAHLRHDTTQPTITPPVLICPTCDQTLRYLRSHIGGVSERHAEQWDYFECPAGCGTFQYRERTRKLRKV